MASFFTIFLKRNQYLYIFNTQFLDNVYRHDAAFKFKFKDANFYICQGRTTTKNLRLSTYLIWKGGMGQSASKMGLQKTQTKANT